MSVHEPVIEIFVGADSSQEEVDDMLRKVQAAVKRMGREDLVVELDWREVPEDQEPVGGYGGHLMEGGY